jgi:hypothetical protein
LAIAGSFRVATNVARLYAARQGNWSGDGSSWGTMRVQTAPKALAVHWSEAGDRTLSFGDTTALVLVFDRQCRVVAENMPRWLEIIQEIQTRRLKVNVYALGLDSSLASAREYWAGLENRVRIVTPRGAPRFLDSVGRLLLWSSLGGEARQIAERGLVPEG